MYQTSGEHYFLFGSKGNGPGFQFPWGIAADSRLVIADVIGHCIQLFQLDGTFIHKFGC